jgi:hypothetical protein
MKKSLKSARKSTTKKSIVKKTVKKISALHAHMLDCVRKYRALLKLGKYKGAAKTRLAPAIAQYRLEVRTGQFAR